MGDPVLGRPFRDGGEGALERVGALIGGRRCPRRGDGRVGLAVGTHTRPAAPGRKYYINGRTGTSERDV